MCTDQLELGRSFRFQPGLAQPVQVSTLEGACLRVTDTTVSVKTMVVELCLINTSPIPSTSTSPYLFLLLLLFSSPPFLLFFFVVLSLSSSCLLCLLPLSLPLPSSVCQYWRLNSGLVMLSKRCLQPSLYFCLVLFCFPGLM